MPTNCRECGALLGGSFTHEASVTTIDLLKCQSQEQRIAELEMYLRIIRDNIRQGGLESLIMTDIEIALKEVD